MIGKLALQRLTVFRLSQAFACKVCDAEKFQKTLVCPDCSEIVPQDTLNKKSAFDLLGLQEDISKSFREIQKLVHPDKYAHLKDKEVIAVVNDAYKVLKSDFERGNLLLKLHGQDPITEFSQFGEEDQEFVVQMLEISEVIFESDDPQELQEALSELQRLREALKKTVNEQFSQGQFKELKVNLAKLNVLNKKLFALEERLTQYPELQVAK